MNCHEVDSVILTLACRLFHDVQSVRFDNKLSYQECLSMLKSILILISFLSVFGCATTDSLKAGSGGSSFEVHGKSYDEIWKAVVITASRSLTIVESDKSSGTLKAEKSAGMTTWGEVVGIFVKPIQNDKNAYTVEIQSMKRSMMQVTGQDWTGTMSSGIKAELGI